MYRFNSRIRRFPGKGSASIDSRNPRTDTFEVTATSGGIGDGFGIGASSNPNIGSRAGVFIWRNISEAAVGGIGDGFGIGASKTAEIAAASGGIGEGLGMGASNPAELAASSGGIGDGFGMGASKCVGVAASSGGMGEGFGIGASNSVKFPANSGGTGEGFGIGASNAVRPDFARNSEFKSDLFSSAEVPTPEFPREYNLTALCAFVPKRANASMITHDFRLISC